MGAQIDFLVLDRPPQPLDEHVVAPGFRLSILIKILLSAGRPVKAMLGELGALVGIKGIGLAVPDHRLLDSFEAKVHRHIQWYLSIDGENINRQGASSVFRLGSVLGRGLLNSQGTGILGFAKAS